MKLNRDKFIKYLLIFLAVAAVIILVFVFKDKIVVLEHIYASPKIIKNFVLSYGNYSALIFIIIYALKPIFVVLPLTLFSILAGHIFGPYYGLTLNMAGCFLSATLAFYLAHRLGKSFVDSHLKGKALQLDSQIEEHGFKVMLLMRLSVVFPYDPLSYAAGLSKMKYKDFILGTTLGMIPEMVCYSFIGESFSGPFSIKFIFPVIAVVVIAVLASRYYKSVKNN